MRASRTVQISVFDKDLKFRGWVSNPVSCSFTQRWWGQGSGEITVDVNDPIVAKLEEPGARIKVDYLPEDRSDDLPFYIHPVFNGPIMSKRTPFLPDGTATYQVTDDWMLLAKSLAWVVPSGYSNPYVQNGEISPTNIARWGQTWANPLEGISSGTVYGLVGRFPWPASPSVYPAETAIRLLLAQNLVKRYNAAAGWTKLEATADAGQGPNVRSILPQVRFGTLEDYVLPLLQAGGLGLRFQQLPGFIRTLIWEPKTWSQVFTPDSGVVVGGEASTRYPTVTDTVVGGPGEEAARAFRTYQEQDGVRATFGHTLEAFRDATGAPVYWPATVGATEQVPMYYHLRSEVGADRRASFESFLAKAGADALADGGQRTSVSVEIAESEAFFYGGSSTDGFHIGDQITVAPSKKTGLTATFTDRITAITIGVSRDQGITVNAQLGERRDDPDSEMADLVKRIVDSNRRYRVNQ